MDPYKPHPIRMGIMKIFDGAVDAKHRLEAKHPHTKMSRRKWLTVLFLGSASGLGIMGINSLAKTAAEEAKRLDPHTESVSCRNWKGDTTYEGQANRAIIENKEACWPGNETSCFIKRDRRSKAEETAYCFSTGPAPGSSAAPVIPGPGAYR